MPEEKTNRAFGQKMTEDYCFNKKFIGWMVLGFVKEPQALQDTHAIVARQFAVLAASANEAMSLVAEQNPNFNPVGALSENELRQHLELIADHRKELSKKQNNSD